MIENCPVCDTSAECKTASEGRASSVDCPNCGSYQISKDTGFFSQRDLGLSDKACAVLSHAIWMHQDKDKPFKVQRSHLEEAERGSLPNPAEQLDLLLVFYAQALEGRPGTILTDLGPHLRAKICAVSNEDVEFILNVAEQERLLEKHGAPRSYDARPTLRGWQRFRELQKGNTNSLTAFMAMPFGNSETTDIVNNVFRPAVEETGFGLKRIDDAAPAGSIDNRMLVEIRMCRFLIADLTDANCGAYWEAGFAEALGKPVIYTCSKSYFEDKGTHFDTNHQHTIFWDPSEPRKAAEDLKSTIRATLPFEANMPEDD